MLIALLAVEIKEIVQAAIGEITVHFRAGHCYVAIGKFHSDVVAGVVVIVKFHINSGTGEATAELIPGLTVINSLTDFLMKYRFHVLVFLFQRRVCKPVFVLDSLNNLVATLEIVALVDCLARHIHSVIYDVKMRMPGFQMADYKVLRVLYAHAVHVLSGKLSHKFIGQARRVGGVKTDGNMSCRILLVGHKSMYRFKRLHHFRIVGSENIFASDDAPCVWHIFFRVVELARQQRIKTDMGDYYIDLVFYNYILKCFLLIDLKSSQISYEDVGQMDMYIRMYDELKCSEGDNPTIGLLLCSETSKDLARYSILKDSKQLYAAKYLTYLPTKEELTAEIERQKEIFALQTGKYQD